MGHSDRLTSMKLDGVTETDLMSEIRNRMADILGRHFAGEGSRQTAVPGLSLHRRTSMSAPASFIYDPSYAFIIRGQKKVMLGDEVYRYDQSHFLFTAIDLPTVVHVLDAAAATPYLSIKQVIDLDLARELINQVDEVGATSGSKGPGMAVGPVTPELLGASLRLIELLDRPEDIPILSRSIQREILYRMLASPVGARLRQVVEIGTQPNRVSAAITWLRANYDRPLRIEELADISGLGESMFHHHFKALTAMSPLQYQKHLRLHEARRLMISDRIDAGSAAHRVGYESATQFNREYRRLFGAPPKSDVRAIISAA